MVAKRKPDEEPVERGSVTLTTSDWALLQDLGGQRGKSEILRDLLARKRNAMWWHRIKVEPTLWAQALQAADGSGLNASTYISNLIAADIERRKQ